MNTVSKIIFASALALSTIAPAFAYEGDWTQAPDTQVSTTGSGAQHVTGKQVRMHRGIDAKAYPSGGAPVGGGFGKKGQSGLSARDCDVAELGRAVCVR